MGVEVDRQLEPFPERRDELRGWLEAAGYRGVVFHDAGVVGKEVDGERQDFPLFLALAQA